MSLDLTASFRDEPQDLEAQLQENETPLSALLGETGGMVRSYEDLQNKPSINGVELSGEKSAAQLGISEDAHYTHRQMQAESVWTVSHHLGKYPSVTVADSAGSAVIGDILYLDENTVQLTFSAAFSGTAYLN